MNFSIPTIIRACVAPKYRLSISTKLWRAGLAELRRRGDGIRESGAFLLGTASPERRRALQFAYYDDIEPGCLDRGYVIFDGTGYGALWALCRAAGLQVVADIHTHPVGVGQSPSDRDNPMIATVGHIALIVPNFARQPLSPSQLGIYVYQGRHEWQKYAGRAASDFLYVGWWG